VSIVTPFYNEAGVVAIYFARLGEVLRPLSERLEFEFVCVNDGSRDTTLRELQAVAPPFGRLVVVDLSRNFGKEAALSAGLDFATGDAVIPMDADLQDPPELIPQMIARWLAGTPVVLAVREDRSSDGWLKRSTSAAFYAVHNRLADTPIPRNAGDFRLIDRRVADVVRALPERQRFMKGLLSWSGFPAETLSYTRPPRAGGRTKWNYVKLMNLAVEGITSFSTAPLRASTVLGAVFALAAMLYGSFILVRTVAFGVDLPGYASVFVAVVFMGGVQLLSLGVLGEYVGRIYMESKQRPVYVVRAVVERTAGTEVPPGA
jgi:glycosyltransferase involved in cell wall biosynthesis